MSLLVVWIDLNRLHGISRNTYILLYMNNIVFYPIVGTALHALIMTMFEFLLQYQC